MSKSEYMRDVAKAFIQHGFVESDGQIYIDVRHKEIDGKVKAVVVVGIDENGLNTEAIMDVEDAREHHRGVLKACQKASALMMTDKEREWSRTFRKELDRMLEQGYVNSAKLEIRILDAVNNAVQLLAASGYHTEAEELDSAIGAFFGSTKKEGKE